MNFSTHVEVNHSQWTVKAWKLSFWTKPPEEKSYDYHYNIPSIHYMIECDRSSEELEIPLFLSKSYYFITTRNPIQLLCHTLNWLDHTPCSQHLPLGDYQIIQILAEGLRMLIFNRAKGSRNVCALRLSCSNYSEIKLD